MYIIIKSFPTPPAYYSLDLHLQHMPRIIVEILARKCDLAETSRSKYLDWCVVVRGEVIPIRHTHRTLCDFWLFANCWLVPQIYHFARAPPSGCVWVGGSTKICLKSDAPANSLSQNEVLPRQETAKCDILIFTLAS
jgi:hypothetical protein